MKENAKQVAALLINIGAISINTKKPFKFSSGILSPIYIDNRLIMSYPIERRKLVRLYISLIEKKIGISNIQLISGTATAAIPMASWVAGELDLPMVYVRKETKEHGKQNKVEGIVKKGDITLIIEDHISTGESSINNAQAIREAGGKVNYIVVATTYETKIAKKNFAGAKLKCFPLTNLEEILKVAVRDKIIEEREIQIVEEWAENPKEWGSKYFGDRL